MLEVNKLFYAHPTGVINELLDKKHGSALPESVQLRDRWHNGGRISLLTIPLFWVVRYYGYIRTPAAVGFSVGAVAFAGISKNAGDALQKRHLTKAAEQECPNDESSKAIVEGTLLSKLEEFNHLERTASWLKSIDKVSDVAKTLKALYPEISHEELEKCTVEAAGVDPRILAAYYAEAVQDLSLQTAVLKHDDTDNYQKGMVRLAQCRVAYLQHLFANPTYAHDWKTVKGYFFSEYIDRGTLENGISDIPTLRGMIK
jgi:hypothetical protein